MSYKRNIVKNSFKKYFVFGLIFLVLFQHNVFVSSILLLFHLLFSKVKKGAAPHQLCESKLTIKAVNLGDLPALMVST